MKPPARKRTKPDRNLNHDPPQSPCTGTGQWRLVEQKNLLKALKTFYRVTGANGDIDYAYLKEYVPNRSISEIQSVVEYLKDNVLSLASLTLKKRRWEEKMVRKPIELWTSMASTVAGTDEEPISAAFSQMLMVSSTEPRTLRYCDPPQVHRPPTDKLVGRTVPFRPMPRVQVKGMDLQFLCVIKSKILAAPAPSPQPASQTATPVTGHSTPGSGSAAVVKTLIRTPQQSPTTISTGFTSKYNSSGPHASLSFSATGQTPVTSRTDPPVPPKPPLSSPAAAFHATMFGVKSVVDFERIYRYLSGIHQPNDDLCHLTPMESAIVLDLLMSLPEELPLLDCNKIHKHLIQVQTEVYIQPHFKYPNYTLVSTSIYIWLLADTDF
uniref:snRNA-activating protein complex subunit 2 n=1 Tax=Cyclopterus lumpus TaxID=8103 RepID=A0A8C3G5F1_CYCLU